MIRNILLIPFIIWIAGCGKQEVKSYKDLIADDALIVCKIENEDEFLKLLSTQLGAYYTAGKMVFPYLDSQREAVFAITDVDDYTSYAAIPLTKDSGDKVLESLPEWQRSKSEVRSNYLFIPLAGELPSSYGKYKYELGANSLEVSIDSAAIMLTGENEVKRFIKRGQLFNYLNLIPQIREPLKELLLDSGIELLKQSEKIALTMKRAEEVEAELSISFKEGSELAAVSSLSTYNLPENSLDKGVKVSVSAALEKLPVISDISTFFVKQWLSMSGKKELVLPLHSLVNDIKKSQFSFILGVTSGNLTEMDFTYESKNIPKLLSSYVDTLTGVPPVIKEGCLSNCNTSIKSSDQSGILEVELDLEREQDLQKNIMSTYSNLWNMLMSTASLRISNSFVKKMIQNLKAPPFELKKILTTVTAGEKTLIFKLEF